MLLNLTLRIQILRYKISNIIDSYWIFITASKYQRARSKYRMNRCKSNCNARFLCPRCKCVLAAKSINKLNECPIDKW